jgi:prefoldin subunit 5
MWRKGPYTNFLTPVSRFSSRRNSHDGSDSEAMTGHSFDTNQQDTKLTLGGAEEQLSPFEDDNSQISALPEYSEHMPDKSIISAPVTTAALQEISRAIAALSDKLDRISQSITTHDSRIDALTDLIETIKVPARELQECAADFNAAAQDLHSSKDSMLATTKKLEQHAGAFEVHNRKLREYVDQLPHQDNSVMAAMTKSSDSTMTKSSDSTMTSVKFSLDALHKTNEIVKASKTSTLKTSPSMKHTMMDSDDEDNVPLSAPSTHQKVDPDLELLSAPKSRASAKASKTNALKEVQTTFTLPASLQEDPRKVRHQSTGARKRSTTRVDPDTNAFDESESRKQPAAVKSSAARRGTTASTGRIILKQSGPRDDEY